MTTRRKLTGEGIERLKPPASGHVDYFDTVQPRLLLRVNFGGRKSWLVRYFNRRVNGDGKVIHAPSTSKIGDWPDLTLREAREKARKFEPRPQGVADSTFAAVAANFVQRHVEAKGLRSAADTKRLLKTHILPRLGAVRIHDLKRRHIASLLDHIEDKHGPRQADVCLSIIRKCLNWYGTRDDDFKTPVIKGMGRHDAGDHKRDRILSDDELRALWAAAGDSGTFGAMVKVLLLTAQRRDKVAHMRWADIVDGEWRIPSEKREKTNAGTLRLPQAVIDIIAGQDRIAGNPYVFPGRGKGQLNAFSQRKEELDKRLPKMPQWQLHDLRRTARSLMSRAGVTSDHAERVLGHAIRGVESVYDHFDYGPEKAAALVALATLIERIVNPAVAVNVTTLRAADRANAGRAGQGAPR